MSDKLKVLKALSDSETRDKIMAQVIIQVKSKKAQEATAACIAEGLGEPHTVTQLTIGAGSGAFLPLTVTVTADGETRAVESVQPENVDYDYAALMADFNGVIAESPDLRQEFLEKTADLLNTIVADNGVADENFVTKIC